MWYLYPVKPKKVIFIKKKKKDMESGGRLWYQHKKNVPFW
jgi:hypothetical protein